MKQLLLEKSIPRNTLEELISSLRVDCEYLIGDESHGLVLHELICSENLVHVIYKGGIVFIDIYSKNDVPGELLSRIVGVIGPEKLGIHMIDRRA